MCAKEGREWLDGVACEESHGVVKEYLRNTGNVKCKCVNIECGI